ncbi:MAG TPA: hypothetical protein VH560_17870 [Polyangia bacterium]|jgi:hypothetical protein|nr:hypothetical protein [Polyangia bacterium]
MNLARLIGGFALAVFASGCAALGIPVPADVAAAPVGPPTVTFSGATLARAPSSRALAAHYCPELVSGAFGAGAFLCQQAFGAPPAPVEMTVSFDLRFHVANPNQVPLPLASALVATTLFPATNAEQLGAACVTLCAAGAPCTGEPAPGACDASSRDVRSLSDFTGRALPQLLLAEGVTLADGRSPTFALPPVVASSAADVVVRYSFGPEQLLSVMKEIARQSVDQLKAGNVPTFTIPYRLEGTVWFDAGTIGRLAVGWGPVQGAFTLPTDGLRLP